MNAVRRYPRSGGGRSGRRVPDEGDAAGRGAAGGSGNKYVHGLDVRIDWCFFLSDKGGSFDLNLKHGHTWKLRKRIYFNTIFTKTKEDSDEKIKA